MTAELEVFGFVIDRRKLAPSRKNSNNPASRLILVFLGSLLLINEIKGSSFPIHNILRRDLSQCAQVPVIKGRFAQIGAALLVGFNGYGLRRKWLSQPSNNRLPFVYQGQRW
jgi:hypothetical protein